MPQRLPAAAAALVSGIMRRRVPFLGIVGLLGLQNLVIFWGHYTGAFGIPWDFGMGYYPIVSFWTSAWNQGIVPEWVPYQSRGYPLALNLQSGLCYPPFWLFPLLGIPHTLYSAIVLQWLHVLAGGIGMYLLARLRLGSEPLALVAACAFQCFGGFYSNAEHADIVRAFALAPWLFYVCNLMPDASGPRRPVPRRALFIPPVVYLLATGGYPGNFLSSMFMLAVYVLAQLAVDLCRPIRPRDIATTAAAVASLTAIGIVMAVVHLGIPWVERGELTRYGEVATMTRSGMWFTHLPSLFLFSRTLIGDIDISMASSYVTLPITILLFFTTLRHLRMLGPECLVGLVSLLMIGGPRSPFYVLSINLLPPLALSRFPSSDYRVFIAIPLMLVAVSSLHGLIRHGHSRPNLIVRAAIACVAVAAGFWASLPPGGGRGVASGLVLPLTAGAAVAGLALLVAAFEIGRLAKASVAGVSALFMVLICLDAWRVLPRMPTWKDPVPDRLTGEFGHVDPNTGKLRIHAVIAQPPATRPARITPLSKVDFAWRGYLTGTYVTMDVGNTKLRANEIIDRDPVLQRFMLAPWTPLLRPPPADAATARTLTIPAEEIESDQDRHSADPSGSVRQTSYGLNVITYDVSLRQPTVMVENELYFRGWRATVGDEDPTRAIEAIRVNDTLRGWLLPAGDYTLRARYSHPLAVPCRMIGIAGLALWGLALCLDRRLVRMAPGSCRDRRAPA